MAALIQHDYRAVTQEDGSAEYYLLRNVAVVFGNETPDVLAEDQDTRQRRVLSYSSNEYRSYVLLDEPMQYYQSSWRWISTYIDGILRYDWTQRSVYRQSAGRSQLIYLSTRQLFYRG